MCHVALPMQIGVDREPYINAVVSSESVEKLISYFEDGPAISAHINAHLNEQRMKIVSSKEKSETHSELCVTNKYG